MLLCDGASSKPKTDPAAPDAAGSCDDKMDYLLCPDYNGLKGHHGDFFTDWIDDVTRRFCRHYKYPCTLSNKWLLFLCISAIMWRRLEKYLSEWKETIGRLPLLVRGARQVGKSYTIEAFGRAHFQNVVVINFELYPHFKPCFQGLDPKEILAKIQLLLGVDIHEGVLLFLDEIQECPSAIMALRYFKEQMPQIPVIGAGSLLEFAMRSEHFTMPVGRVGFLYMEPLSFSEFLAASGHDALNTYLAEVTLEHPVDIAVHEKLLSLLRTYFILGGMPAVVSEYLSSGNIMQCQQIQTALLQAYRSDFGKYAATVQQKYLQRVFDTSFRFVGQRVKYSHIDSEMKSRDLKQALQLLALAGIIRPIYASHASGVPLGADLQERKLKLNVLDIGLMQNACGLQSALAVEQNFLQINAGALAEQFVGQELRAYADPRRSAELYFWARDQKSSTAEVDYVTNVDAFIVPIEVKSGKRGTLRSLQLFLAEKPASLGVRIAQTPLSYHERILSIPLYLIAQLPRLVAMCR
ncbi:MAG: ATP-binding protein [Deltaproteobacteria bacterium]|nr:ATP-binding protein [Deltaproteobacteria bacterium]